MWRQSAPAARIEAELGPIDILVNNAGMSRQARLEDFAEADYDAVMGVNLRGAFFAGQAAAAESLGTGCRGGSSTSPRWRRSAR